MTSGKLTYMSLVATFITIGATSTALAQANETDPARSGTVIAQTTSPVETDDMMMQDDEAMPCRPGRMPRGMMGSKMMMQSGMMGMRTNMMKMMFAIADTDGDGALSFDEVVAVHKRIFTVIDANKDGKVTPEELQMFMRGQ